ncbi:hypothetical protein CAPTEDRAFT_226573 [Capitella teleta]|uniref:Structure-specific endonuclease subunit SLX1 homolog n=1 Tax=Capitella teleta TaxID=283909 RepID=R7T845_CAPTE|nr:hypothetical protein CAPTEDRAFT_226573 [Capitella teleta]|eukprot:ELT87595.1 hypothetical protein CAPTEDRAFT_226573 [Capitella teleta]
MVHEIENFFGVYILYNVNPRYKGQTYIGFTVDPNRRVKQHNTGRHAGGAKRTDGRGPWEMVIIVHGFPNKISALGFEWAWQNPHKSRRLKHVNRKQKTEDPFQFRLRVVCEMLRSGPWTRLPLTFRWLKQQYTVDFDPRYMPPKHMPVAYGPVKVTQVQSEVNSEHEGQISKCCVCHLPVLVRKPLGNFTLNGINQQSDADLLKCLKPSCDMASHLKCLARLFLSSSTQLLPIDGPCPKCKTTVLWGDLIRAKRGCYQKYQDGGEDEDVDSDHWADELQTQIS